MNLDGGGSTTMVVHGNTVTRNANSHQRHVASSIAVIDMRTARNNVNNQNLQTLLPDNEVDATASVIAQHREFPVQTISSHPEAILAPPETPADLDRQPVQEPIRVPKKSTYLVCSNGF